MDITPANYGNSTKITPSEVIANIQAHASGTYIMPELYEFLERRFERSRSTQVAKGVSFELDFSDMLKAITRGRINTMHKHLKAGTLASFMRSDSGYVLTWKSKEAYLGGVMNADTIMFVNRNASKRPFQFVEGDTHSEASKAKISKKLTGRKLKRKTRAKMSEAHKGLTHTDETKAKIAASKRGVPKTEEQNQAIRDGMARARAAKAIRQ